MTTIPSILHILGALVWLEVPKNTTTTSVLHILAKSSKVVSFLAVPYIIIPKKK